MKGGGEGSFHAENGEPSCISFTLQICSELRDRPARSNADEDAYNFDEGASAADMTSSPPKAASAASENDSATSRRSTRSRRRSGGPDNGQG